MDSRDLVQPGSHNCLKSLHNSQETVTHATVTTTQATPSVSLQVAATLSGCSGLYDVVFGSPPPLYEEVNRLNGIIEANHSQRTADLLPPSYEAVKDPSPLPSYQDVERGHFVQMKPAYVSL